MWWDVHPVLLPSGCSWHARPNVKLSCYLFPPLITSFHIDGSPLSAFMIFIPTLASWAASMRYTLLSSNIVDKATVLERTCSAAYRTIIKSNCLTEHNHLHLHRHSGTKSRALERRLGTLHGRCLKHQSYSPILSNTEFVALHTYPFLLGLRRLRDSSKASDRFAE